MRVLITGITGMAGSHLADYLLSLPEKIEVYGTFRWRSRMENVAHLEGKINLIQCELTDFSNTVRALEISKPDFIFHLAAQSYVLASWSSPTATMLENPRMQINLFEAMLLLGIDCPIQVALSSEEYGMVYPNELPINEDNPLRPLSPYAVSKVTQDMMAYQYYKSHGLKTIRTRAFNHEGPRRGDVFVTSNFAKQIALIEAGKQEPVIYVGNLKAKRDWSDVRDVVRAYWLAVNKCIPGEVYVIASGKCYSVEEMLNMLLDMSTVKVEIREDPARMRPSDVMVLQGDASKFKAQTGWEPAIPLEQTLADLLNHWREEVQRQNVP
ncbi:MAG: GDP-mannose 4,6-dehydratase [Armatimonadetes bacterium]|nr:GDP-mannose 4,6-dehydratase [Armatimonadota bacterium]